MPIDFFLMLSVVGRITALQRGPHPNQQDKYTCEVTWPKGIGVADGIKVATQLTLRYGDYPR